MNQQPTNANLENESQKFPIKVAVRLRPFFTEPEPILFRDEPNIRIEKNKIFVATKPTTVVKDPDSSWNMFEFDYVYNSKDNEDFDFASQEKVFREIGGQIVEYSLRGYNTCLLTYGQSGSGKTFTMMGTPDDPGIIPRIMLELFDPRIGRKCFPTTIIVSFLEIYQEKLYDLLVDEELDLNASLRAKESSEMGVYVPKLTSVQVETYEEAMRHLNRGCEKRLKLKSAPFYESSRSHAVFTITIIQKSIPNIHENGDNAVEKILMSKIHLVDLGGLEGDNKYVRIRLRKSHIINKSLSTLEKCIDSLVNIESFPVIPYKESALTFLLKDCLGGNSVTFMIATISPEMALLDGTLSTLIGASKVSKVVNTVRRNQQPTWDFINTLLRQNLFLITINFQEDDEESNDTDSDSSEDMKHRAIGHLNRILTIGSLDIDKVILGPQEDFFNNLTIEPTTPRLIGYLLQNDVSTIACGYSHTIFIDEDRMLQSFGLNNHRQLGRDTDTIPENYDGDEDEYRKKNCMLPGYVECGDLKFLRVAAGSSFSVGRDHRDDVYVFGQIIITQAVYTLSGKVDIDNERAIEIAAGDHHIVILTNNAKVYTFGNGSFGQLGRINVEDLEKTKIKFLFLKPQVVSFNELERSEKITNVFAGKCSSYAVTSLGNLYAWGENTNFQLGFKTKVPVKMITSSLEYYIEPFPVKVKLEFKVKEVALGYKHLLLLDTNSRVHSCGSGLDGCLGLPEISLNDSEKSFETPQLIERELFNGEAIKSIACGNDFSLALTQFGNVYAWGKDSYAFGVSCGSIPVFRPTKITGPVIDRHNIREISAGYGFCAFIGHCKCCPYI